MLHLLFSKRWRYLLLCGLAIGVGILLSRGLHAQDLSHQALAHSGGETTVRNRTSSGYSQPAPNLSDDWLELHTKGDGDFEAVFVTPPATVNAGLGPLYNNASCAGCHIRDGRGMPKSGQLLVRVSLPRGNAASPPDEVAGLRDYHHVEASVSLGNAPPVPGIGTQIQELGVYGYRPEAQVEMSWQDQEGTYADGTGYKLRSPQIRLSSAAQPLPLGTLTSARIPSPVFGLGLLEAVPDEAILRLADPEDRDGNGISGRPNRVWDVEKQTEVLGRFGWKANNPDLLQQTASAYVNDMGVTNPLFLEADGSSEIDAETLEAATVYVQTLAVPARTLMNDPQVKRGELLFKEANCAACHIDTFSTGSHKIEALAHQTIHPYTDMLLHDMGEGLADNRPDFLATGSEWRTPPLWGIGLTHTVLPYSGYLHDGRARTLEEAILWHGGEATASKETFRNFSGDDRAALIRFLRSL